MAPIRVELTMRLAHEFGLWNQPAVTLAAPAPATDADLQLVHDAPYVSTVEAVSRWAEHPDARHGLDEAQLRAARMFGLGTEDNPVFPGMHEASALVTGATLAAAHAVWSGPAQHGASIAGGMHHAMAAHASGFCVYNDVAVAIAWLLGHGAERIAYVDIDAHHGDGVQAAFWDDPRVLTISLKRAALGYQGRAMSPEISALRCRRCSDRRPPPRPKPARSGRTARMQRMRAGGCSPTARAATPPGMGTMLTAVLFSGGRAALAHRRLPRIPAPRRPTPPDHRGAHERQPRLRRRFARTGTRPAPERKARPFGRYWPAGPAAGGC